jgi:hypothetical protein
MFEKTPETAKYPVKVCRKRPIFKSSPFPAVENFGLATGKSLVRASLLPPAGVRPASLRMPSLRSVGL